MIDINKGRDPVLWKVISRRKRGVGALGEELQVWKGPQGDFSKKLAFFFFLVVFTSCAEPNVGLELMTLRSRPELRSRVRCLTD